MIALRRCFRDRCRAGRWLVLLLITGAIGAMGWEPPSAWAQRRPAPARTAPRRPSPARRNVRPPAPRLVRIEISPAEFRLTGPGARQLLLVTGHYADGSRRDLSAQARYTSLTPRRVRVGRDGTVYAVGDGAGRVRAVVGTLAAEARVAVSETAQPRTISFTRDILPLLTRAGCNSLACHGSPVGKAGFKLSMYGYDAQADYFAIMAGKRLPENGGGARIDFDRPERSLLLLKPTATVPHLGGPRFRVGSPEYETLLAWLKAGAPADDFAALPRLVELRLAPADAELPRPGSRQRLLVTAIYSDGTSEDVSHQAIFSTNDSAVAIASEDPVVEATGAGETVVLARHRGKVGVARVRVPPPWRVTARDYAGFAPANFIDQLTLARWRQLRLVPSALSDDTEFLRRVSLDLTGTLPTPEEVRAFVADRDPHKRARKIDELLNRPEYADWWAVYWSDALRVNGQRLTPQGARTYHAWIREQVARDRPLDAFARDLILATGQVDQYGPANFYRAARTPGERAEQVASLFTGIRLECANCHNHPFERWTQANYHSFAAFFVQVRLVNRNENGQQIATVDLGGPQVYRGPEGKEATPAVLGDQAVDVPRTGDRRDALARWLTAPENPFFARALANRLWAAMFGRGIVDPVDDFRSTNPPSNPALLDALAEELIRSGFSARHLLRLIANSTTYQLSCRANRTNAQDRTHFSRRVARRLSAEQLVDAISHATGVPEPFPQMPAGTRAIQLPDRVASFVLDLFGRPPRQIVCACERAEEITLSQVLHFLNGNTVNNKIADGRGRVAQLAASSKPTAEIVTELYLWTLGREPTAAELRATVATIDSAPNRRQALEDRLWVLINMEEFWFNH